MQNTPLVLSIFTGGPKTIRDEGGEWISSILRAETHGPVEARPGGLAGDRVAQPYHGGPDADICVHLMDHYRFWNERYGLDLRAGNVGENFTLEGIREDEVCAGDLVRVGGALLQVSGARTPCANLQRRIGRADWVSLTVRENRCGFYLRVLEAGPVQAGDAWELRERFNPSGSISAINRCMFLDFDPAFAEEMQAMRGLADWWKEQARERGKQGEAHWTARLKDGPV